MPRHRRPRPALALLLTAPLIASCAPPGALKPTLTAQRDALARAAAALDADYRLLDGQAGANLDTRERLLLGAAHREMIERGHITPDLEADTAAFDADLADPDAQTALLNEVRLARVTREEAHVFLHDYALAMRMRREGRGLRDAMLSRLRPVADARRERDLIAGAIEARRRSVLSLLQDAAMGAEAVSFYAERASIQDDERLMRLLLPKTTPPDHGTAPTPDPSGAAAK